MSDKELAGKLQKPMNRKFNKRKVRSPFIGNIYSGNLGDMKFIIKFHKRFRLLLRAVDIYGKYAWVIVLRDKKGILITDTCQKILGECNRKAGKIWVDKGSEFYIRPMKSWLEKSAREMHLTNNKRKSAIAERFIRTIKNKIYKYMTSISKNVYIDKLHDIVNKYNNIYHSTIKIKPNIRIY